MPVVPHGRAPFHIMKPGPAHSHMKRWAHQEHRGISTSRERGWAWGCAFRSAGSRRDRWLELLNFKFSGSFKFSPKFAWKKQCGIVKRALSFQGWKHWPAVQLAATELTSLGFEWNEDNDPCLSPCRAAERIRWTTEWKRKNFTKWIIKQLSTKSSSSLLNLDFGFHRLCGGLSNSPGAGLPPAAPPAQQIEI